MSDYQLFVIALRVPRDPDLPPWTPDEVIAHYLHPAVDEVNAGVAECIPQDENNGWASAMLDAAVQLGVLDERNAA